MNTTEKILEVVDEAIEKGTFNLEAVRNVQELRDAHTELQKTVKDMKLELIDITKARDGWRQDHGKAAERAQKAEAKITDWEKREAELTEREIVCRVAEAETKLIKAHIQDMKGLIHDVFRNPVLKRIAMEPVVMPSYTPHPDANGYSQSPSGPWVAREERTETETAE